MTTTDSDLIIGNRIYTDRHMQSIDRRDLAITAQISYDALKRIENGIRKVKPTELYLIAKRMGRTMEHYLGVQQLQGKGNE